MNPVDPAQRMRLADQVAALDRLIARVEAVRLSLPAGDSSRWSGPAGFAFESAIRALGSELGRAVERLTEASAQSRRALAGVTAGVR